MIKAKSTRKKAYMKARGDWPLIMEEGFRITWGVGEFLKERWDETMQNTYLMYVLITLIEAIDQRCWGKEFLNDMGIYIGRREYEEAKRKTRAIIDAENREEDIVDAYAQSEICKW